jgi:hypothetical protein
MKFLLAVIREILRNNSADNFFQFKLFGTLDAFQNKNLSPGHLVSGQENNIFAL